jgi:hypothetical protein
MFYVYTIYTRLSTADHAPCGLRHSCNLNTWTVVLLTAAKFKPLIFSVLGFALSYIADIYIFMSLYDLLPA